MPGGVGREGTGVMARILAVSGGVVKAAPGARLQRTLIPAKTTP